MSGKPFLVGRIGANEEFSMRTFECNISNNYGKALKQLNICAGFFPIENEITRGKAFLKIMKETLANVDLLGLVNTPLEKYFINKCANANAKKSQLLDYYPWNSDNYHWTKALKGKKVLIVYPFTETIENQYNNYRTSIFNNEDILPEFKLITYKSVQTSALEKDDRFSTWEEALNYMHDEIKKIDYDIAIIGCGSYGLPLASMLKNDGKQAIHMGGSVQVLFGIIGKRWEDKTEYRQLYKYLNRTTYLNKNEQLKNQSLIEGGIYW